MKSHEQSHGYGMRKESALAAEGAILKNRAVIKFVAHISLQDSAVWQEYMCNKLVI